MNANWSASSRPRSWLSRRARQDRRQQLRQVDRCEDRRRSGTRSSRPAPASSASAAAVRRRRDLRGLDRAGQLELSNPDDVNGGVNHFGSPFNFPEEFVTVYRLHPLVPDLHRLPRAGRDPNAIAAKIPVVDTFRGKATAAMHERRPRQLGAVDGPPAARPAHAATIIRSSCRTSRSRACAARHGKIDVAGARPHPRPRARHAALQRVPPPVRAAAAHQLRRFHRHALADGLAGARPSRQQLVDDAARGLRPARCDASKIITAAQLNADGKPINDCLGHAERHAWSTTSRTSTRSSAGSPRSTRPHGFAISETQFHGLHPERVAPAVQRPLLHLELPARVLHARSASTG